MADLETSVAETAKANVAVGGGMSSVHLPPARPIAPRPVPAQVGLYVQTINLVGELTAGGYRKELQSLSEIIKHSLEILG